MQSPSYRSFFFVVVLLILSPLAHAEHLQGTWSGTHETEYTYCSAKPKVSGKALLILGHDNLTVAGSLTTEAERTEGCKLTPRGAFTVELSGPVIGVNFKADITYPGEGVIGTATGTFSSGFPNTMVLVLNLTPEAPFSIVATLTKEEPRPEANPNVVVSSFPTGMIQRTGEATAADSFTLTNTGTAPAEVVVSTISDFIVLPVLTVTIAPGGTHVIGFRSTAQSTAGGRFGEITVQGGAILTIPVSLLTGETSLGEIRPTAPTVRPETVAPATQKRITGRAVFTNSSTTDLLAIAVADVPWISFEREALEFPAGKTVTVFYEVDRDKRLDADSLIGGAAAKISLRFVGGSTASAKSITPHGSTNSTVSVQIVDAVKPGVTSGAIPAPIPGEIIYFIAGLDGRGSRLTDLLLSNRGTAKTTDLRMYFSTFAPGSVAKLLNNVAGFDPNVAVAFPSMAKNVFDAAGQVGTLQIRGTSASGMAIAAVQLSSTVDGRYATVLPVLRSDRAAGAGERITLAGVEENATAHTALFIQEVAGVRGSIQIDFMSSSGALLLPARPADSVNGHALLEATVPAGAAVARITVASDAGAARFAAYALVTDDDTGDSWVVSDLIRGSSPPSNAFVVPLVDVDGQSPRRTVYLTNSGTSAVDATFEEVAQSARRRTVVHGFAPAVDATLLIQPEQTITPSISIGNGYLRFSSPSGTLAGSARSLADRPASGGSFGTGLIALPVTASIGNGESKRITGIDDASDASRVAATHGTYRSTLILVETAGERATVRLTLRYVFASGTKVSAFGTAIKEISIGAKQMLTLPDLARAILGHQRNAFGDLINSQLDIEVIDGNGRVGAMVQSVDNGSGDVLMRE